MKLNLGCGSKLLNGYINVDKFSYYPVDVVHDLEVFPYPWENSEIDEILMSHVLEHIGQCPDTFNSIIKELYRICKHNALIKISVPHARHDDFLADPTHVRPITILGLSLYDKKLNLEWAAKGAANTPLGLINDVDFRIESSEYQVEEKILIQYQKGELSREQLDYSIRHYANIVKQIHIVWRTVKI